MSWPLALVVMYLSIGIDTFQNMPGPIGKFCEWINRFVHLTFLGVTLEAKDILRVEFIGYVIALGGFVLARVAAPHWAKVTYLGAENGSNDDARTIMQETITKNGDQIPARDLAFSLDELHKELAAKTPAHDWSGVESHLMNARKHVEQGLEQQARQDA